MKEQYQRRSCTALVKQPTEATPRRGTMHMRTGYTSSLLHAISTRVIHAQQITREKEVGRGWGQISTSIFEVLHTGREKEGSLSQPMLWICVVMCKRKVSGAPWGCGGGGILYLPRRLPRLPSNIQCFKARKCRYMNRAEKKRLNFP